MTMTTNKILIENVDYIINADGNLVFTASYLLKRGHCCQSGCLNCPYGHTQKIDPNTPAEFNDAWQTCYEDEEENDED